VENILEYDGLAIGNQYFEWKLCDSSYFLTVAYKPRHFLVKAKKCRAQCLSQPITLGRNVNVKEM